jgi:hypothetical protein
LSGSSTPCSEADERFDNHLTADAEKAYRAILSDDPDSDCAATGMTDVVMRRCREAGELLNANELKEAEKAYLNLLAFETPSTPPYRARTCAFEGLVDVRLRQKVDKENAEPSGGGR